MKKFIFFLMAFALMIVFESPPVFAENSAKTKAVAGQSQNAQIAVVSAIVEIQTNFDHTEKPTLITNFDLKTFDYGDDKNAGRIHNSHGYG